MAAGVSESHFQACKTYLKSSGYVWPSYLETLRIASSKYISGTCHICGNKSKNNIPDKIKIIFESEKLNWPVVICNDLYICSFIQSVRAEY